METQQFGQTADILESTDNTMKHDSDPLRQTRPPRLSLRPLAIRRYAVPGYGQILARLWRLSYPAVAPNAPPPIRYAIELHGLGYRRFCLLEGDEDRARAILDLVARHTVTPCALQDVLEEL